MGDEKTVTVELTADDLDELWDNGPDQWGIAIERKMKAAKAVLAKQTREERLMLPWRPFNTDDQCLALVLEGTSTILVCHTQAIRRLIEAAPAMAELLEHNDSECHRWCGRVRDCLRKAGWID